MKWCYTGLLTQDEMEFGLGLKGVVQRDQERRLANVLQNLPLCPCVFCRLRLLNDRCLLQNLRIKILRTYKVAQDP